MLEYWIFTSNQITEHFVSALDKEQQIAIPLIISSPNNKIVKSSTIHMASQNFPPSYIYNFISFNPPFLKNYVLRQVHRLYQIEFYTKCDIRILYSQHPLVSLTSTSSCLRVLPRLPLT